MAQDGGARGGTFHGEIDLCGERQGRTTACSSMPEREGENIKERIAQSKSARAGLLAIGDEPHVARTCILPRRFS